jgi:hypothetical protein
MPAREYNVTITLQIVTIWIGNVQAMGDLALCQPEFRALPPRG